MEHVHSQCAEHLSHTRTLQDTWDTVVSLESCPPRSRISQFLTHSTPDQNITQQQQQQNAVKVLVHVKFHKNEISFAAVCLFRVQFAGTADLISRGGSRRRREATLWNFIGISKTEAANLINFPLFNPFLGFPFPSLTWLPLVNQFYANQLNIFQAFPAAKGST